MSATLATAIGRSKHDDRTTETEGTRRGEAQAEARAQTFRTFATAIVNADGSGSIKVERTINGKRVIVGAIRFGAETEASEVNHVWLSGQGVVQFPNGVFFVIDEPVPVVTEEMLAPTFDMASNGGQF